MVGNMTASVKSDETGRLPHPQPVLLLAAVALALFLSSMWTARADTSGVSTEVVYTTRFVSLAVYMFMAWSYRNHLPQVRLVLGIGCSFMLVHLAWVVLSPALALDAEISSITDYLSGVFEGVANALITLVLAHILSSFDPRKSAVGVGVAYLLVDVGILILDTLSVEAIHYARPLFTFVAVGIVLFCTETLLGPEKPPFVADKPLQYGFADHAEHADHSDRAGHTDRADRTAQDPHANRREVGVGDSRDDDSERALNLFSSQSDWFLLLIVAILFPTLFGVIAQVSSETGGNFALYDIPTEIVMIAIQALFLLFMAFYGTRYGFAHILAFIIPLYATGFALFPNNWQNGNPFAGCLIRAGFVILAVLLWALMERKSFHDPRHTYLYFGIYCGVSNGQVGRLTGSLLMGENGPNLQLCQDISLAALWSICIFGLVLFFLLRVASATEAADRGDGFATLIEMRGTQLEEGSSPTSGDAAGNAMGNAAGNVTGDVTGDAAGTGRRRGEDREDTFADQFERLADRIHLTQREREVVVEALHGYSRASIANKLCLSPETVKTYLNRAYVKAQVTSKQELIAVIERE